MKEIFSTMLHSHQCHTLLFSFLSKVQEKYFLLSDAYVHTPAPQTELVTKLFWYEKVL